jgi:protein required for attachment to host cells
MGMKTSPTATAPNKEDIMQKSNNENNQHAWFALADAEHCRLLRCSLTGQGTRHVDELGALENTLPQQEHARPTAGGGPTHNIEEAERRFAGDIAGWLEGKAKEHTVDHLVIFAPPRMLGVLRKAAFGALKGNVEEIKGDLMRLAAGQLADHPMIGKLIPANGAS